MIPTTSTSISTAPTIDPGQSHSNGPDAGGSGFAEALAGAHTVLDTPNSNHTQRSNSDDNQSNDVGHEAQNTTNDDDSAPVDENDNSGSEGSADDVNSQGAAQEQTAAAATNQTSNDNNASTDGGETAVKPVAATSTQAVNVTIELGDDAIVTAEGETTAIAKATTPAPAPAVTPSTGSLLAQAQIAKETAADAAAEVQVTTTPTTTTTPQQSASQTVTETEVQANDVATSQKSSAPGNEVASTGPNPQPLAGLTEVVDASADQASADAQQALAASKAEGKSQASQQTANASQTAAQATATDEATQTSDDAAQPVVQTQTTAPTTKPATSETGNSTGESTADTSSEGDSDAAGHSENSHRNDVTPGSANGQAHRSAAANAALARAHGSGEVDAVEPEATTAPSQPTTATQATAATAGTTATVPTAATAETVAAPTTSQSATADTQTPQQVTSAQNAQSGAPSAGLDKAAAREAVLPQMNQERIDHIADQLSARLRLSQAAGGTQVHLSLRPRELGDVNVSLTLKNGSVHATVYVDRPETGRLLQGNIEELRRSLTDKGLSVDQFSVDVKDGQSQGALDRGLHNAFGQSGNTGPGNESGAQALAGSIGADGEWETDTNVVTPDDVHNGIVSVLA